MALKKAMKEIEQNEMKKDYKNKYNNLAPINTLSQDDVYIQALNWAFNDSSIKNIALTGPYGAGKSSILLSFLKQYDNIRKNTLTISLASFIDKLQENQDKNSTEDKTIRLDIDEIEKSILKQLFYKVDPLKIPQSRFHRIRIVKDEDIFFNIVSVFIFLFFCIYFFWPQKFNYLTKSIYYGYYRIFPALCKNLINIFSFVTFIGLILAGICLVKKIVKWIVISFHMKRVTIQGSIQAETGM